MREIANLIEQTDRQTNRLGVKRKQASTNKIP